MRGKFHILVRHISSHILVGKGNRKGKPIFPTFCLDTWVVNFCAGCYTSWERRKFYILGRHIAGGKGKGEA